MPRNTTALAITSPADNGYSNSVEPVISFTGAVSGDTVTVTSSHDQMAGGDDGSTIAGLAGSGSITPTTPLAPGPNTYATLTLSETDTNSDPVGTPAMAYVQFDIVPEVANVAPGSVLDAGDVSFEAVSAIPNDEVKTVFTPLAGSGPPTEVENFADSEGNMLDPSVISPALAPNEYSAATTTIDGNDFESDAVTTDFFVAPAQPTISSLTEGEDINQSAPDVTVSGVLSDAIVQLYTLDTQANPVLLDQTTASAAGNLTFTGLSALTDGRDQLYAVQTVDENGTPVSSDGSASQNAPQTPAALVVVDVDAAAPAVSSFSVADGATTQDTQPWFEIINGPVDLPNNIAGVEFFLTGPSGPLNSGLVQTDGSGQTTWQPTTALPDGAYTIYARSVDDSGHVGDTQSNSMSFTVDTTAPSVPTVVSPADGSTVASGSPVVTVNGDAGSQMCVVVDPEQADTQELPCQSADSNGNATFALSSALSDGEHTLLVMSSDDVGNTSQNSATFTVAIPTPTPTTPTPTPTPTPPPTPTPTPKPTPKPTPPAQAPKALTLSSHTVSAAHPVRLGFTLSKPGTVTVKLTDTAHGTRKVVGTVVMKITKAGQHNTVLTTRFAGHKLGKGSYTLSLQAGTGKSASKAVTMKLTVQ